MLFSSFSKIITDRLKIRFLKTSDHTAILRLQQNEQNLLFLDRVKMKDAQAALDFIKDKKEGIARNQYLYWAITIKNQATVIGTICLWNFSQKPFTADIGYELHPDYQKKGFMNEAVMAILDFGFHTLSLETIAACTNQNNLSSIRLLEKNNFSFVKKLTKEEKLAEEENSELLIYAIQNDKK